MVKSFFVMSLLLIGLSQAKAQQGLTTMSQAQPILSVDINSCTNWRSLRTSNGDFGYVCSSYPFRDSAADYRTTQRAIEDLQKQISDLQSKVKRFETNR